MRVDNFFSFITHVLVRNIRYCYCYDCNLESRLASSGVKVLLVVSVSAVSRLNMLQTRTICGAIFANRQGAEYVPPMAARGTLPSPLSHASPCFSSGFCVLCFAEIHSFAGSLLSLFLFLYIPISIPIPIHRTRFAVACCYVPAQLEQIFLPL